MEKDVICNPSEIRIAYHNMERYTDFLTGQMRQYIKTLSRVQETSICDELIASRLSSLADEIRPQIASLEKALEAIRMSANREISEINAADGSFQYPGELLARVSSLLASFLP